MVDLNQMMTKLPLSHPSSEKPTCSTAPSPARAAGAVKSWQRLIRGLYQITVAEEITGRGEDGREKAGEDSGGHRGEVAISVSRRKPSSV